MEAHFHKNPAPQAAAEQGLAVAAVAVEVLNEHGLDIASGLLAVAERVPFVGPFATVLNTCLQLFNSTIANKAAALQYKQRLVEVSELVKTAVDKIATSNAGLVKLYTERLTKIIADSTKFIEEHTKKGFFSRMLSNKKVEAHFRELDKGLTEVMQQLIAAVGLEQYNIAERIYEIFDAQAFLNANGGASAVQADEKKLEELAGHLEFSLDDLRSELVDYLQRIEEAVKDMHQAVRADLQEVKELIKAPAPAPALVQEAPEVDKRLLRIDRERVLGEGGFGLVYAGKYNNEDVAVKTLRHTGSQQDDKSMRELRQEVKVLFILGKYPGFVRLFGASLVPGKGELCIVLEMADGSLDDLIHTRKLDVDLTFQLKTSIALDITRAMDVLHGLEIIFRDMKPQNVLVFFKGREKRVITKLTDFGLARGVADVTTTIKGTIPYMAPELFQSSSSSVPYSFASDVYALGVSLNELMLEQKPFSDFTNVALVIDRIKSGQTPVLFRSLSSDLPAYKAMESIVKSCVARDPGFRPHMSTVVENVQRLYSAVLDVAKLGLSSSAATSAIRLESTAVNSYNKKLADLSVEDVVHLMRALEMPVESYTMVKNKKITGRVLSYAESVEDLTDCGLLLSNLHKKSLLESIAFFRSSGVPAEYLCSTDSLQSSEFVKEDPCVSTDQAFDVSIENVEDISIPLSGVLWVDEDSSNGIEEKERMQREEKEREEKVRIETMEKEREEKEKRDWLLSIVRRYCAEAKEKNRSPLYLACEAGDKEGVQALLLCTLDMVNNESEDVKQHMRENVLQRANKVEDAENQRTALHIAARNGYTETVSLFLTHRANIEVMDKDQSTPLYLAAGNGHTQTVSLLLTHRANIEAMTKYERTPLHDAAFYGHTETVSFILTHKANIEAKDDYQSTPLHYAANKGHTKTVSLLLTHKADIEAKNKDGRTPLDMADNEQIKTLLGNAKKN